MSRKINSLSLRLGLTQVWSTTLSFYGKNLRLYQLFWFMNLENYINKTFFKKKLIFGSVHWIFKLNKLLLIINYVNFLNPNLNTHKFYSFLFKVLQPWINFPFCVYTFKVNQLKLANFICSYFYYSLVNNKSYTIPNFFFKTIRLNTICVVSSSIGPVFLKLKGCKIKYSGRIDNSRSSMSKTIQLVSGSTALLNVSNHIDYAHKVIYTKLGTCSVHVWTSYSKL